MITQDELNDLWADLEQADEENGGDGYPFEEFEEEMEDRGGVCLRGIWDQAGDPIASLFQRLEEHGYTILEDPSGIGDRDHRILFGPDATPSVEDTERVVNGTMRGVKSAVSKLIDEGLSLDEAIGGLQALVGLLQELKVQQEQEAVVDTEENVSPTTMSDGAGGSSASLTPQGREPDHRNGTAELRKEGHLLSFSAPCPS